jgi:uncharacterized protein
MEIIDIHTHIFPDVLADGAIKFLENEANTKAFHNGTAAGLRQSMRQASIELSVQHPVATKPSQVKSINDWAKDYLDGNGSILSFGGMHPAYKDIPGELKRMKELGFKGYKLHPEYQKFYPDDPSVFPMYEATIMNDLIILFHTGEDIGIKPPYYSTPDRMTNLLKAFPKLRMIFAHMGGWMLWDDVEKLIIGEEVFLETSYTMGLIPDERFMKMIRNHGVDRVLFGTDSPWRSQKDEVEKILSLPFSDDEKEHLCSLNAKRLLDLT